MVFAVLSRELTKAEINYIKQLHRNTTTFMLNNKLWQTLFIDEINRGQTPYITGAFRNCELRKTPTHPENFIATHVLNPRTFNQYKLNTSEVKEWEFKSSFPNSTYSSKFILPNSMIMISEIIILK